MKTPHHLPNFGARFAGPLFHSGVDEVEVRRARHQRTTRTSFTRRKRRTRGESTDSTNNPAGSIQSPSTGKNQSVLPATRAPPNAFRPVLDRGSFTRNWPTRT